MRKRTKIFLFILFSLILVALFILFDYIKLEDFIDLVFLKNFIKEGITFSPVKFILIYILVTSFFIPSYFMTLNSSIIFGIYPGFIYSIIGVASTSIIVFFFSRIFAKPFIEGLIRKKYPQIYNLDISIEKNGFFTVLFFRILPIPFNLINLLFGITKVHFKDYFIATLLWMIPEILMVSYFGSTIFEFRLLKLIIFIFLLLIIFFVKDKIKFHKKCLDCN